ncbi:hypothetical protein JTB14_001221 [Gonioctena quinquepunctata]|nr:hypothetical protein JTB14_001221 [Gonioctena quinquepunctata]
MLRAIMGADLGVELDMPPILKEWLFNTSSAGTASWAGGRGHRLEMALRISPLPVRRVATREIPSKPGYNWVTLPSFHCKGLRLDSLIKTKSSTFSWNLFSLHFCRPWSSETYSTDHLPQRCCHSC